MKKLLCGLLAGMMVLLAACGGGDKGTSQPDATGEDSPSVSQDQPDAGEEEEEDGGTFSADKGLLTVELTVPAAFIDEDFDGELTEEDKANGFKSVKRNDDGSATYTISRGDYEKYMQEMRDEIGSSLEEIPNHFDSVKEVTVNKDFTEVTLIVDQSAYENSFDSLATLSVAFPLSLYHTFNGSPEDLKLTIHMQDEETGEIFDTTVFPDDME